MFKLIKTVGEKLINLWQRANLTKTTRSINEEEPIHEQMAVILKKQGITTGIRSSGSKGQAIAADTREDGAVDYSVSGESRQGETGNTKICQILVNRLNRDGANWGRPIDVTKIPGRLEDGIDCEAKDGSKVLKIQVTRAERDPRFWEKLNHSHEVNESKSAEALADALRNAIKAKAAKLRTPQQRGELILALDATLTPSHAFQPAIDSFRNRHGNWAVELGFQGIWVVGPNVTLTSRLDEQVHS